MGGTTEGKGVGNSAMGRLGKTLLDTGVIAPMLKELFSFADVDAESVAKNIADYLGGLLGNINPKQG